MSVWHDYVTAAIVGSEKAAPPALPATVESALADVESLDPAARFLTQAGALALWRRAGWNPGRSETKMDLAEPETALPVAHSSVAHLRTMLGGRWPGMLSEWLGEAARLGRRVPPELLPALLDRARQSRELRPLVLAAGGRRAHWLAKHNSDWTFAEAVSPDLWETGERDQRAALIRSLRHTAPGEARAKVEAIWKTEPADVRTLLLSEFAAGLSDDDLSFLEKALDDRSKEVRRVAVDLLARLPSSPLVSRMLARVAPLLSFQRGGLLSRASLKVTLPSEPDAAALRDGLDAKAFGPQKKLGEKAVLLVLMLSAIPLRHWTETFQQAPAAILDATAKNEFARALATGWAWAAIRQRDAAWAAALLDGPVEPHVEFLPANSLLAVLPEEARATRLAAALRAGALKKGDHAAWHSFAAQLSEWPGYWPPMLAREVLSALRHAASSGIPWHLRSVAESLLLRIPPSLLAEAALGWPIEQEGAAELVGLLTFRHEALAALSQT